ncbi:MAG: hypothetical protein KF726_12395 [Anaerolineae bacterium]|nr:hypothetical protein [Anaerolineae bacterium]
MIWYYSDIEKRFKSETNDYCAVVIQILGYWTWQLSLKNANGTVGSPLVNRRLRCHSVHEAQAECERVYDVLRRSKGSSREVQSAQVARSW